MSKSSPAAIAAVLLVSAFAAGAVLYRMSVDRAPAGNTAHSDSIEATPATLIGGAPIPKSLPDFNLPDLQGKPHSIREWGGRPLMINFWATWCAPCREEIPLLIQLRAQSGVKNLEIVGIAVDLADDVAKYVANTPISYPILVGEDGGTEAASAFGVHDLALPFTVFLDRHGRVFALRMGQLHQDQATLILSALQDLESGRLDLAAAQARVAAGLR